MLEGSKAERKGKRKKRDKETERIKKKQKSEKEGKKYHSRALWDKQFLKAQ